MSETQVGTDRGERSRRWFERVGRSGMTLAGGVVGFGIAWGVVSLVPGKPRPKAGGEAVRKAPVEAGREAEAGRGGW